MNRLIIRTEGVKALIVDDSDTSRLIAKSLLTQYAIEVTCVRSGAEAIQAVKETEFDLIILDCVMPEMDGHETARQIRALPAIKAQVPIIAYTASAPENIRKEYQDVAVTNVLGKPLNSVELSRTLLKCLPDSKIPGANDLRQSLGFLGDYPPKEETGEISDLQRALLPITELDYPAGLRYSGGNVESYLNILNLSKKNMDEVTARLRDYYEHHIAKTVYAVETVPHFATTCEEKPITQRKSEEKCYAEKQSDGYGLVGIRIDAHSMKGVLACIGLSKLSETSYQMEQLAAGGETTQLEERLQAYIDELEQMRDAIAKAVAPLLQSVKEEEEKRIPMEKESYRVLWDETEESVAQFDIDQVQEGLHRLYAATEETKKREALRFAVEAAGAFDYTTVSKILKQYREMQGE